MSNEENKMPKHVRDFIDEHNRRRINNLICGSEEAPHVAREQAVLTKCAYCKVVMVKMSNGSFGLLPTANEIEAGVTQIKQMINKEVKN